MKKLRKNEGNWEENVKKMRKIGRKTWKNWGNFMEFVEHDGKIGEFVGDFGENYGKWRKKLRIFDYFDGKGGCLKGRRGQRKDEKASKNFSTGMGARWEKKTEILKEKVGWKSVRDLRKGGRGER